MLDRFFSKFGCDGSKGGRAAREVVPSADAISSLLGGRSFNNGLYRVHLSGEAAKWTKIVVKSFSQFSGRIECFGYDWLGRQFALDSGRVQDGVRQVLMFQIGAADSFEIPCNIIDFHNDVFVDQSEPALEESLFLEWLSAGHPAPGLSQCVGYKSPPMLGGQDEIENFLMMDMEVEWAITDQIITLASKLPKGVE